MYTGISHSFYFQLAASKALGVPLTIYCQSNIDPGKKEFLLHEGANLVLHGNDCVEAELKARSDARVYKLRKPSVTFQNNFNILSQYYKNVNLKDSSLQSPVLMTTQPQLPASYRWFYRTPLTEIIISSKPFRKVEKCCFCAKLKKNLYFYAIGYIVDQHIFISYHGVLMREMGAQL